MPLKHILMSVRPEHAENIIEGRKVFEYRRRPPLIEYFTTILIYATLPTGKVIGEVTARCTLRGEPNYIWSLTARGGCITRERFDEYFKGMTVASAISLESPLRYEHPLSLHKRAPQSWQWL